MLLILIFQVGKVRHKQLLAMYRLLPLLGSRVSPSKTVNFIYYMKKMH